MGGLILNAPIATSGVDGVKKWWEHRINSGAMPIGKEELRSLLGDTNGLSSFFEQSADGAGPADRVWADKDDDEESQGRNTGANIQTGMWAAIGLHEDDEGSDVAVDISSSELQSSKFDSFLSQWRTLHDFYNIPIPDMTNRWREHWQTAEAGGIRMTTIRANPQDTTTFSRDTIEQALHSILRVDSDLIEALWSELDADGSGVVDRDEAQHWWEANLPSHDQAQFDLAWARADFDCSMGIEFEEAAAFINFLLQPKSKAIDAIMAEVGSIDVGGTEELTVQVAQRQKEQEVDERSNKYQLAITEFHKGLKILDSIDVRTDQRDALESSMKDALRKAENNQMKFSGVTMEAWQIGRKYLKNEWEVSAKGVQSTFPRYILKDKLPRVKAETGHFGTDTETESETELEASELAAGIEPEFVNSGAIRCAFQVSHEASTRSGKEQLQEKAWLASKAIMAQQPVVVRVYVIEGTQ